MWLFRSFFQNSKLQDLKIAPIWGIFLVVLRDLAKKVGRVQIFGWEFLAELRQCYSLVIPTLQGYLRQFFYRNGRSALYTPARRKSREYSILVFWYSSISSNLAIWQSRQSRCDDDAKNFFINKSRSMKSNILPGD